MTTLPEILRDVQLLLADERREYVVIARGDGEPLDDRSSAYQLRVWRETMYPKLSCEARSWLGGQWSQWRETHGWLGGCGFDTSDVLAVDWRIIT